MDEYHKHRKDCQFAFAPLDVCDCVQKNMADRIEALEQDFKAVLRREEGFHRAAMNHLRDLEQERIKSKNYAAFSHEWRERCEALEAQVRAADALAEVCMTVDGYLTRLQTPGTEPLNSVNGSAAKQDRNYFTAQVRNEAREQWAALGNALAAYTATKEGGA